MNIPRQNRLFPVYFEHTAYKDGHHHYNIYFAEGYDPKKFKVSSKLKVLSEEKCNKTFENDPDNLTYVSYKRAISL